MAHEGEDLQAARYARISEDKTGEESGVTRQLADEDEFAKARGLPVVATYQDNDISAKNGAPRPGYLALVAAIESGKVNVVIVWQLSRLWRNRTERAQGIEVFKRHRVRILCCKGPDMDLSTAYGRAMVGLLGEFDTMETDVKGERTVAAQLQKAAAGRWLGGTRPFGWKVDGGTVRRHPREAAAVRKATRAVLAGETLASIMRDFNDQGLTTTTGRPWGYATLRQMLMRSRNAGIVEYGGERVGAWPALVTEDEHRAVVKLLESPDRRKSQSNRPKWLLTGILTCACGAPMRIGSTRVNRTSTDTRFVYRCYVTGVGNVHSCPDAATLDRTVERLVVARLSQPDAVGLLTSVQADESRDTAAEVMALREELTALGEAHGRGEITLEQLVAATKLKRDRLAQAEAELEAVDRDDVLRDIAGKADAGKRWQRYSLGRRRAIVRKLFVELTALQSGRGNKWAAERHLRARVIAPGGGVETISPVE